jgi:hypothetical protein
VSRLYHRRGELEPDADAVTLLSRALRMARRRMHYRVGAALIVAATLVVTLLLFR